MGLLLLISLLDKDPLFVGFEHVSFHLAIVPSASTIILMISRFPRTVLRKIRVDIGVDDVVSRFAIMGNGDRGWRARLILRCLFLF